MHVILLRAAECADADADVEVGRELLNVVMAWSGVASVPFFVLV